MLQTGTPQLRRHVDHGASARPIRSIAKLQLHPQLRLLRAVAADAEARAGQPSFAKTWRLEFLSKLQSLGHAPADEEDWQDDPASVKGALLKFGRARPDIIFALDASALRELGSTELYCNSYTGHLERKLANAYKRIQAQFASPVPAAELDVMKKPGPGASTQDLLRVLWHWAEAPPADQLTGKTHEAAAALLQQILDCAAAPPNPQHMERARQLGTPSEAELVKHNEGRAAYAARMVENRRLHLIDKAASKYKDLRQGDWICGDCGATNWFSRSQCIRCGSHANANLGHVRITMEDLDLVRQGQGIRQQERWSRGGKAGGDDGDTSPRERVPRRGTNSNSKHGEARSSGDEASSGARGREQANKHEREDATTEQAGLTAARATTRTSDGSREGSSRHEGERGATRRRQRPWEQRKGWVSGRGEGGSSNCGSGGSGRYEGPGSDEE